MFLIGRGGGKWVSKAKKEKTLESQFFLKNKQNQTADWCSQSGRPAERAGLGLVLSPGRQLRFLPSEQVLSQRTAECREHRAGRGRGGLSWLQVTFQSISGWSISGSRSGLEKGPDIVRERERHGAFLYSEYLFKP